jgi:predicted HAD superfamily Cof-like phosphohydrolase
MTPEQRMVQNFHETVHLGVAAEPIMPDEPTWQRWISGIREAFDKLIDALARGDLVATAKALADLLYVVYGTAVVCGIDLEPVFQEAHRSKMRNVGGGKQADSIGLPSPDGVPPDLAPLRAAQPPTHAGRRLKTGQRQPVE